MNADRLDAIRDLIQQDVNDRGLRTDLTANLVTACAGDFRAACAGLAGAPGAAVAVVTGFFIPHATPPAGETDGPLGALFLARALTPLGVRVALVTDGFCRPALEAGLAAAGLKGAVPLLTLPAPDAPWDTFLQAGWLTFARSTFGLTHLVALERVGPSHTLHSLQWQAGAEVLGETYLQFLHEVPPEHQDRCHNMRGADITEHMAPAHLLFEAVRGEPGVTTVGIGDGGNEIGMGKVPWQVVRGNIPEGSLVACRVPTDHLIVCGVSNWGAYGLAAGVYLLRGLEPPPGLFDPERERCLLEAMVEQGPLVDGVTGRQAATVDGLSFDRYAEPLRRLGGLTGNPERHEKAEGS
jgi:hypothetical protein